MRPARFITLEGGEGAGKSTQCARLRDALAARGVPAITTREPGGSAGAEAIRALLMQGDTGRWNAMSEALLFAAARADHLEKTIRPALARGEWVICDRFVDSTRAYQGAAGGIDDAAIVALHRLASGGEWPDRTFLLDIDEATGAARSTARDGAAADRFAARGADFHSAVARGFRELAATDPARFRVIDASATPEAVTAAITAELADWL